MSGTRPGVSPLSAADMCHSAGTRSPGAVSTLPCLLGGEARADQRRRAAPVAWHSVLRRVEVEDSEGRVAQEEMRFIVVHSSQLAQQHAQTYAKREGSGGHCGSRAAGASTVVRLHGPMPRPPSPPMRARGRAAAGASRASGGITRSAMVLWPAAACAAPSGPSRQDRPAADRVGLSPRGRGGRSASC